MASSHSEDAVAVQTYLDRRSRRRKCWCEFSAQLLAQRPTSWRWATLSSFIAALSPPLGTKDFIMVDRSPEVAHLALDPDCRGQ